jgi:hypothetical protein
MGFFGVILLTIVILAVFGLGWKSFSSGVIAGFDKAVEVSTPIVKNLTQEAREYVNNPDVSRDQIIKNEKNGIGI